MMFVLDAGSAAAGICSERQAYCLAELCVLACVNQMGVQKLGDACHAKVDEAAVQQLCQTRLQHHLYPTALDGHQCPAMAKP